MAVKAATADMPAARRSNSTGDDIIVNGNGAEGLNAYVIAGNGGAGGQATGLDAGGGVGGAGGDAGFVGFTFDGSRVETFGNNADGVQGGAVAGAGGTGGSDPTDLGSGGAGGNGGNIGLV